jgi:hypothetical protein
MVILAIAAALLVGFVAGKVETILAVERIDARAEKLWGQKYVGSGEN